MDDARRRRKGTKVRREVLGGAHVARATAEATALDREFQDLVTRYVWGEIWTRPGLPRHTRRLLTIAMLVALDRGEELRLHLRAALHGGVTLAELREVLLQAAVYCGVPAAHNAFRIAGEVLAETGGGAARRRRPAAAARDAARPRRK
jgi:4-carboxymuconolactone decarboxylase